MIDKDILMARVVAGVMPTFLRGAIERLGNSVSAHEDAAGTAWVAAVEAVRVGEELGFVSVGGEAVPDFPVIAALEVRKAQIAYDAIPPSALGLNVAEAEARLDRAVEVLAAAMKPFDKEEA